MNDPRTQIRVSVGQRRQAAEPDHAIHQEGGRERSPAASPRQHLRVLPTPEAQPPQAAAPEMPEPREALRQGPGAPAGARQEPGRRPWAPPPPARGRGKAWRPQGPGSARRLRPAAMWAGGLLTLALLIPALVVATHQKPDPAPAPIPAPSRPGCAAADGTAAGVRLFNEDGPGGEAVARRLRRWRRRGGNARRIRP